MCFRYWKLFDEFSFAWLFLKFDNFCFASLQVIKDYDYDKDGKLNMAEYSQYKSDVSDKSSDNDEVVFKEIENKKEKEVADQKDLQENAAFKVLEQN